MTASISITLNGEPIALDLQHTLAELIHARVPHPDACAVAINGRVIPRSQHGNTPLQADDQIEIVRAVGGG